MVSVYRFLLLLPLLAGVSACGIFTNNEDPTAEWSAKRLYDEARGALDTGNYQSAIEYYEKLDSRYPFGPYAQQGHMEIVYAYYKGDEPASAIAAADRFIKLHPRHPHVDYVYYIKGLTNFNQGKGVLQGILPTDDSQRDPGAARQAFEDFSELVQRFPDSEYTADAAQRMVYLRNNLAKYELHVASYYMRRKAYVAAANRARYVIENYQRTPSVSDALVLMANAYREMELYDLAADALRVLELNYPEHSAIPELAGALRTAQRGAE
ncbi:MAG: outer membrane protein assembly factor BamD [Gammaproteobacteria bacterium]|nr:outer membrane protein assembly factor BamD [Gammaproteobacteria bacterium]NIR84241.1 outer membrane protein assembly factor BamD [Gammaproteobacteria bacterium]NIR89711.1 outer membrane protein assembly factor BamD [Gammaproteobacteria bacterium]NIU05399.1 outer membrane protein assembly factor BamD [Gammaproteobacteria bacterium]NIV52345.1 outer membrane protein assembly factor BamD [Gammaproteobacteria bacterium]